MLCAEACLVGHGPPPRVPVPYIFALPAFTQVWAARALRILGAAHAGAMVWQCLSPRLAAGGGVNVHHAVSEARRKAPLVVVILRPEHGLWQGRLSGSGSAGRYREIESH